MSKPRLKLDFVDAKAARYAVTNWHYSKRLPVFKTVRIGAWEDDKFIGVVMFGSGATPEIGKPFGLTQFETCELVRVALDTHTTPTSRIVAIALRLLRKQSPGIRLVVSFADSAQGHHGGIYQAGGWLYLGGFKHHAYRVNGEVVHPKTLHSRYGRGGQSVPWLRANVDPEAERLSCEVKHKYVMPLDAALRAELLPQCQTYPKRAGSSDSGTVVIQTDRGGANPTPALSISGGA